MSSKESEEGEQRGGPATNQNKSTTKEPICEEEGGLESGWGRVGELMEGGVVL